jgi:hypothetical protein
MVVEPTRVVDNSPFPFRLDEPEPAYTWFTTLSFWFFFLTLTGLTWTGFYVRHSRPGSGDVIWPGVFTLLVLPGVQIIACALTLIVVVVAPKVFVPDKGAAYRRVSCITLWGFVGALAGLGVMAVVLPALLLVRP